MTQTVRGTPFLSFVSCGGGQSVKAMSDFQSKAFAGGGAGAVASPLHSNAHFDGVDAWRALFARALYCETPCAVYSRRASSAEALAAC